MDNLIKAIRQHPLVGKNTGSFVDETTSDGELGQELQNAGIQTVDAALQHVLEVETVMVLKTPQK